MKHICFPDHITIEGLTYKRELKKQIGHDVDVVVKIKDSYKVSETLVAVIFQTLSVSMHQFKEGLKTREAVTARQLYVYFMSRLTTATDRSIADFLGNAATSIKPIIMKAIDYLDVEDPYFMSAFYLVREKLFDKLYETKTDTPPVPRTLRNSSASRFDHNAERDERQTVSQLAAKPLQAPP